MDASQPQPDAAVDRGDGGRDAEHDARSALEDAAAPDATVKCDPSGCQDGGCIDPVEDEGADAATTELRGDGCRIRQTCIAGECIDRCASSDFENEYSFEPDPDPEDAYCLFFLRDCGPNHDDYWHNWTIAPDRARCAKRGEEPYDATENVCVEGFEGVLEACGLRLTLD